MNIQVNRSQKKKIGYFVGIFLLLLATTSCTPNAEEQFKAIDLPLIEKSESLERTGHLESCITLQNVFLKTFNADGYKAGEATCFINLAQLCFSADPKNYLIFLDEAKRKLVGSKSAAQMIRLYTAYAKYYNDIHMPNNAFYYTQKALTNAKKINDNEIKNNLLAEAYKIKGKIYADLLQSDSAYYYYYKSRLLKPGVIVDCLLAKAYLEDNKPDSAKAKLTQLEHLGDIKHTISYAMLMFNRVSGDYFFNQRQFNEAENAYLKSISILDSTKFFLGYNDVDLYKNMADIYYKRGDLKKEKYYITKWKLARMQQNKYIYESYEPAMASFLEEVTHKDRHDNNTMRLLMLVLSILVLFIVFFTFRIIKKHKLTKETSRKQTADFIKTIHDKRYDEVMVLAKENNSAFLSRFKDLYPKFIEALLIKNSTLENSEQVFCAYIKLGFTTKEIATYTFVQPMSVQQRKRRLRKRLGISSDVDLYTYFDNLTI
ncbi:hypothetical protein [Sphingobacterium sp.]|uniref:hypothetical protein n=1 Tax=Sphingobacterium sp. TaxID=341027 RepID=UPI0031D02F59